MNQDKPNTKSQNLRDTVSWRLYKNTWIFLEENKEQHLSKEDAKSLLDKNGLMIRNTYDFDTKEKHVIGDHLDSIVSMAFNYTGRELACASSNGKLQVWDIKKE